MKIGRNQPCPCKSGRKYKHCHGRSAPSSLGNPSIAAAIQQSLEKYEAQRLIRAAQQGHGRPIISAKVSEHQVVAVGNHLHFSKTWKTFIDFLGHYIKSKLTSEWGNAEIAKPLEMRHTIMQWYDAVCKVQAKSITKPGEPASWK